MDSQQESPTKRRRSVGFVPYTKGDAASDRFAEFERKRQASVVYFLRCGDFVKIGYSYDPAKRVEKIQVWSPYDCEILGTASGGPALEKQLHAAFAGDRHRGEWFRVTDRLLAEIRRLCKPPTSSV